MRILFLLLVFWLKLAAQEANVGQLTLIQENGFNEFDISVAASLASDRRTIDLSGTALVRFNIDPATGKSDQMVIEDADISASDVSFTLRAFFLTIATLDAEGLKGTAATPDGIGEVNPETGNFDAALYTFTLNAGTLNGEAGGQTINTNITETPISGVGQGTGTVTISNPVESSERKITYDVAVTLPISLRESIPTDTGITADVDVRGTLKAVGTIFVIRPPTYQEWATDEGISESETTAFDLHPSIPNKLLFALGHDSETIPSSLFTKTPSGLLLNSAEGGMRDNILIEYSSDLRGWSPLPAGRILSLPGFPMEVSTPDAGGYYRLITGESSALEKTRKVPLR